MDGLQCGQFFYGFACLKDALKVENPDIIYEIGYTSIMPAYIWFNVKKIKQTEGMTYGLLIASVVAAMLDFYQFEDINLGGLKNTTSIWLICMIHFKIIDL